MTGPILALDKSAFQGLSLTEHIYLSKHFFVANAPTLIFEVLGDLSKLTKPPMTPEQKVAELARKFGGSGGPIMMNWQVMCGQALLGAQIPMTGQVVPDNWRSTADGRGMIVDLSPLNESILRWRTERFATWEKEFAAQWRAATRSLSFGGLQRHLNDHHVVIPHPANEADLIRVVDDLLGTASLQDIFLTWLLPQLDLGNDERDFIRLRWRRAGQYLTTFAPYAAHCIRVMLALVAAVRHRLLRWDPTHLLDVSYLYYLPFCQIFCSDDRTHRLLAPMLCREDQAFIRPGPLKADLRRLAEYADSIGHETKVRHSYALGFYPPPAADSVICDLWERFAGLWAERPAKYAVKLSPDEQEQALTEVREMFVAAGRRFVPRSAGAA